MAKAAGIESIAKAMSEAMAWMAEVGAQWDERLAALERQLAASGRTSA